MILHHEDFFYTRKKSSYILPKELACYSDKKLPLYVLVALWGVTIKSPITVNDVRKAFNVSMRRAVDLLEYPTKYGDERIVSKCDYITPQPKSCLIRRAWTITSVDIDRYCNK
ncbi:TPA: CaiF/GrlA family transcriptional regulator [Klebsiella pneumoniae]|nr:CaiF/GrlA family transcriptional regulator [Klebsiella pneumoniae]